jgi:GT2 family glycosyltransferase
MPERPRQTRKDATPGINPGAANSTLTSLVSLIVVNYNGGEATGACLDTLLSDQDRPGQVIVVDNCSNDGSRDYLQMLAGQDVIVIWNTRNVGYAGAVNLGAEKADRPYLAVMNMDVTVTPGWLAPLVAFLEANPSAGAVTPLILLSDGERINAEGQDIHITGLGFNRHLYHPATQASDRPALVSGIHGAAFVVRRSLFEQVGGMDGGAFLYHEDVNISWLLQMMGYDLYCVPASRVRHEYDLSMHPSKLMLLERNRVGMLFSYYSWPALALLSVPLASTELMMWGYCLLQGWPFIKAKATSYSQVVKNWARVIERRILAQSLRRRTDWQLLGRLRWLYAFDQFRVLARERGARRRSWELPQKPIPQH